MTKYEQDNIIPFRQAERSNAFQPTYPISRATQKEFLDVYQDVISFIMTQYFHVFHPLLRSVSKDYNVSLEKRIDLEQQLFWLKITSEASQGNSVFEEYILETNMRYKKKPLIISWLREWNKAVPTFYYVSHKSTDHHLILVDLFQEEIKKVIIIHENITPIQEGEIVLGTLLPIGGNMYFPIVDFYHFEQRANSDVAAYIHEKFQQQDQNKDIHNLILEMMNVAITIEGYILSEEENKQKRH